MSARQGQHAGVQEGAQVAGLEGHRYGSAVYLVHRGLGRRRAEGWKMNPPGVYLQEADAITAGV